MAGRKTLGMEMAVVVLGLLAMVLQSSQASLKNLHLSHPDPAYLLITDSLLAEKHLNESGHFVVNSYVDLLGRRFVTGKLYSALVIYVRTSSSPSANAAVTVQIAADHFEVAGIIHFGTAGTTNASLKIGAVAVPHSIGYTGLWDWLKPNSNEEGDLVFGDFNLPQNGKNLLGSLKFEESEIMFKKRVIKNFWIYASPKFLRYASKIEIDSGDVVVGRNSSSSDIYVTNPSYAEYIAKKFCVQTFEMISSAIGLAAKPNGLKFISFQGISNRIGGEEDGEELATKNTVKAVVNFIWQATVPRYAEDE